MRTPSLIRATRHFPLDRVVSSFYIQYIPLAYDKELPDDCIAQSLETPRVFPDQHPGIIGDRKSVV